MPVAHEDSVDYLADVLPWLSTRRMRLCDMPAFLPAPWEAARASAAAALPPAHPHDPERRNRLLAICISGAELALLKKLDYPCSEPVLASTTLIEDEGFGLTVTKSNFESLAGFAAGDANDCRKNAKRRQQLLYNICEALECAPGWL